VIPLKEAPDCLFNLARQILLKKLFAPRSALGGTWPAPAARSAETRIDRGRWTKAAGFMGAEAICDTLRPARTGCSHRNQLRGSAFRRGFAASPANSSVANLAPLSGGAFFVRSCRILDTATNGSAQRFVVACRRMPAPVSL
jgi:hypothetical protein